VGMLNIKGTVVNSSCLTITAMRICFESGYFAHHLNIQWTVSNCNFFKV